MLGSGRRTLNKSKIFILQKNRSATICGSLKSVSFFFGTLAQFTHLIVSLNFVLFHLLKVNHFLTNGGHPSLCGLFYSPYVEQILSQQPVNLVFVQIHERGGKKNYEISKEANVGKELQHKFLMFSVLLFFLSQYSRNSRATF